MTEAAVSPVRDQAAAPPAVERLRSYLSSLPQAARQLLAAEIERARQRGDAVPGGDLIIAALRAPAGHLPPPEPPLRRSEPPPLIARDDDVARLLFEPLEPFLVAEPLEAKVTARIARQSLAPVWIWLTRDALPREIRQVQTAVADALSRRDEARATGLVADMVPVLTTHCHNAIAEAATSDLARKKLIARIGGERVLEDLPDILMVLQHHEAIAATAAKSPATVRNLADEGLANVRSLLDPVAGTRPDLIPFCLALFQNRLVQRAHLVRLAIDAVDSDNPVKIAGSGYRQAVDLVICEIERSALRVTDALIGRRMDLAIAGVKEFHDTVRSLRTDMSLSGDGPWQRRLSRLRADLAKRLTVELESLPGEIRRLLRPRQKGEAPQEALSEDIVMEMEARLDLLATCRQFASEIALNELTLRISSEIQAYLDPTLTQLLEAIRSAPDTDRALKISQIEAAVRFSARIFGPSYAQLLQKAADVAINGARAALR